MTEWTHSVDILGDLVATDRYPLHDPGLAAYAELLERTSGEFRGAGFTVLPDFVRPEAVAGLAAQCDRLAPLGHRVEQSDGGARRSSLVVAYDLFPLMSPLRRLYEWDGLLRFVAGVTGESSLFRSADPLGALELLVMSAGEQVEWHEEPAEIVVSLVLQSADIGGALELGTAARASGAGSGPGSHVPTVSAGSLLIARGGAEARVWRVGGNRVRHELRMAFATAPGTTFGDRAAMARYGRLPGPGRRG